MECAQHAGSSIAVVLLQDTDGDTRLPQGARQVLRWARHKTELPPCAIGTPHRDAEAWFMALLDLSTKESLRNRKATKTLNFDPTRHPERLTSCPNDKITDAKRVVRYVLLQEGRTLTQGRPQSRPPTPDEADTLSRRLASDLDNLNGFKGCELTSFLQELETVVTQTLSPT